MTKAKASSNSKSLAVHRPKNKQSKSSSANQRDKQSSPENSTLIVGSRITVFCEDDDSWYHATVISINRTKEQSTNLSSDEKTSFLNSNSSQVVTLEYDGGVKERLDLKHDEWHILSRERIEVDAAFTAAKLARINRLKIGSRVYVYWALEHRYFMGTLKQRADRKSKGSNSRTSKNTTVSSTGEADSDVSADALPHQEKLHFIEYDDGDSEWTNLYYRKFKRIRSEALQLEEGSRIFVPRGVGKQKRNYRATVLQIDHHRLEPHQIEYDSDRKNKKQEWIDLYLHPFRQIPSSISRPKADLFVKDELTSSTTTSSYQFKKRKQTFLQDIPEDEIGRAWQRARVKKEEADAIAASSLERCSLCPNPLPAEGSLQTTSCHHYFCPSCVQTHLIPPPQGQKLSPSRSASVTSKKRSIILCPRCQVPITPLIIPKSKESTMMSTNAQGDGVATVHGRLMSAKTNIGDATKSRNELGVKRLASPDDTPLNRKSLLKLMEHISRLQH